MAPRSSTTSSRSPPSDPSRPRRTTELLEAEFGSTPASLPRKHIHSLPIPPPPLQQRSSYSNTLPINSAIPPSLLRTIATSSDPSLSTIDFSNKILNNESLFRLLSALEGNTTVNTLNLSSCGLGDNACQPIAELLSKNTTLQTLHLDNNCISVEGAAALSTALITNEVLKSLTLTGNPLGDRGLIYLAKACGHNSTLNTLELESCGITQTGRVEQLQNLLLKRRIDSNFESLLERLQDDDYRVTGIDLSGRPLGDGGIHRLSEALADNTQVRQLWLRDCSVSDAGAKVLASCLEQNMSIVDLFLGGNDVTDQGLGYICDALRGSNLTLVSLEMDDNRISERGVRDFIQALVKNTSVLVATFENNVKEGDGQCLVELDRVLEERRKGMNLVSFVVDPEEEEEEDENNKSGLVNMSVCSSYMPSTYRRAGFRSVASTKYSKHSPSFASNNMFRNSTHSGQSVGSHVFSVYNKTSKQGQPQNVSAAAAAVHPTSHSPAPMPPAFAPPPTRHSPPQARVSPPQAVNSPEQHQLSNSDRTSKQSSRRSKPSDITRPPPPPARNGQLVPNALMQPQGFLGEPQSFLVVRRSSSGSKSRSRISSKSNDPPATALAIQHRPASVSPHQSLVKVDSVSHSSSRKSSSSKQPSKASSSKQGKELQLTHHIAAMKVIQEEEETQISLPSSTYSEVAENYDRSLKSVCRRVEMMRLMNYFTSTHYRSRHFWFWFTPISSCIFIAGILSLTSAIDMGGMTTTILSLCTAFFALMAFVLNFLQGRYGWSSLAQSHRSASLELAKVGIKLEELQEYEGALASRSVSSRSRSDVVREVYRIDVYLTAMQKCTPDIPKPIDQAFRLLVQRMDHFGKKYPNAIKARLQDYDEEYFDPEDPIPLEMQLDAFDLLCQNIRKYRGFPLFLPNPQNMVGLTTTTFFAKQGRVKRSSVRSFDSRSRASRSSYSRRSSDGSYSRSSYGSGSYYSYDSRSRTRTTRSGDMYSDDMYTESRVV
ncbi:hypothetical protein ACHAWO_013318 [Cyclotella atomus]|uniref:RNI-like protein n=1 Tax=Cyclotella atomus TaxID=382360 RepID=A0ABD3P565_9STRA